MHSIAIFGGTFDPVHNGHLLTSKAIQNYFKFDSYLFLPCNIPVIKSPARATKQQRVKMLELALNTYPQFRVDLREIERNTPSYMVNTLQSFRDESPEASISLIIGYDAFLSLPQWHQWEKIIGLANLLVINRDELTERPLSAPLQDFIQKHQHNKDTDVLNNKSGLLVFFDAGNYAVSSTQIRNDLKSGKKQPLPIPEAVFNFIKVEGLYQ